MVAYSKFLIYMEEVKKAVLAMNLDGAAGPDGFGGSFYASCWDIIKFGLTSAVHAFFRGHPLPVSWMSTLPLTIPKVSCPTTFYLW
ncbi:hypothetical protein LguiA_036341 [Lonicera macranthoides]